MRGPCCCCYFFAPSFLPHSLSADDGHGCCMAISVRAGAVVCLLAPEPVDIISRWPETAPTFPESASPSIPPYHGARSDTTHTHTLSLSRLYVRTYLQQSRAGLCVYLRLLSPRWRYRFCYGLRGETKSVTGTRGLGGILATLTELREAKPFLTGARKLGLVCGWCCQVKTSRQRMAPLRQTVTPCTFFYTFRRAKRQLRCHRVRDFSYSTLG